MNEEMIRSTLEAEEVNYLYKLVDDLNQRLSIVEKELKELKELKGE